MYDVYEFSLEDERPKRASRKLVMKEDSPSAEEAKTSTPTLVVSTDATETTDEISQDNTENCELVSEETGTSSVEGTVDAEIEVLNKKEE